MMEKNINNEPYLQIGERVRQDDHLMTFYMTNGAIYPIKTVVRTLIVSFNFIPTNANRLLNNKYWEEAHR